MNGRCALKEAREALAAVKQRSGKFLGEPDEKSFGTPNVAEQIRIFILDHFSDKVRVAFAEAGKRVVEVLYGEHDPQVAKSIHGGVPVIRDRSRRQKSRKFEPAVAVRRAHHRDLDALAGQSRNAPGPLSFDHRSPLKLKPRAR